MTEVYIVTCFSEGCEECGHHYHVVGAYSSQEKADAVAAEHDKTGTFKIGDHIHKHLHSWNAEVSEVVLDKEAP